MLGEAAMLQQGQLEVRTFLNMTMEINLYRCMYS